MKKYNIEVFDGGARMKQKYDSNPIHRKLISGFMNSLLELLEHTGKKDIYEFGCGEGQVMGVLHQNGYTVAGFDLDETSVNIAKKNFQSQGIDADIQVGNIYSPKPMGKRLVICCEVLEHLAHPDEALQIIREMTDEYFIVSVPREPLWCALNFVRGKYWKSLGNTPGHINHWSKRKFVELCSAYGTVIKVKSPLPWTMVLVKKN